MQINVTPADIKSMYPQTAYIGEDVLQVYINEALDFAQDFSSRCSGLNVSTRKRVLVLLVLHLYEMSNGPIASADGSTSAGASGVLQAARVGDVSVTAVSPNNNNDLDWFFNQTVWGQKLLSLLSLKNPTGFFWAGRATRTLPGNLKFAGRSRQRC